MLQGLEWSPIPWQADPPLLGGGLVHVRDRDCFPPPQVLLQLLHLPHSDQPSLTPTEKGENVDY